MQVLDTFLDAMGNTPLVRLHTVTRGLAPTVLAKLEMLNPGGSVKDRIGIRMIEDAERRGLLLPGRHDRRADVGQHGSRPRDRRRDPRLSLHLRDARQDERRRRSRCCAPTAPRSSSRPPRCPGSPRSRTTRSPTGSPRRSPAPSSPTSTSTRSTPRPTTTTTGPEIWEQTGGRIDVFVAGVGTGGTITGVGRFLKEVKPEVTIVGADTEGSVYTGRRAPPLPDRRHRRGLLARDVRSGRSSTAGSGSRTATPSSRPAR